MTDDTKPGPLNMGSGRWRVRTRSGAVYVLDLDRHVMIRERGFTDFSAALRRDGGEAILLEVIECEVGRPMLLLIDLSWPGVMQTTRATTPVTRIERIGGDDDSAA
ncbi:hypothetical protein [Paramicrobacterium agarici]|uniref:hypothetical protein n=1 Tax=Paramicrobacterium agarici TaxID=630514 RepID=UPI00114FA0D8|nr:hypothetical protein [Microbacterium agarici]TQO22275.1 hypothetical protein FB385_1101 [Microbacterium agarici]